MGGISRRSIVVDSFWHETGIPVATRVGPLIMSSAVAGWTPGVRELPDDIDTQLDNVFTHIGNILEKEDAGWQAVVKMDFWLPRPGMLAVLERPWTARFPDPAAMPARHSHVLAPDAGYVLATFVAYAGAARAGGGR
jgi:enamine deaminase RidA (YjgF/YER057c/UK114 family)